MQSHVNSISRLISIMSVKMKYLKAEKNFRSD